jgi:hypothetical protein
MSGDEPWTRRRERHLRTSHPAPPDHVVACAAFEDPTVEVLEVIVPLVALEPAGGQMHSDRLALRHRSGERPCRWVVDLP